MKQTQTQTAAERQARFRQEQRKLGRTRAEYWLTDAERRELDRVLAQLRAPSL